MQIEREYGVDVERELAADAGVIDALEDGAGDDRFVDVLLGLMLENVAAILDGMRIDFPVLDASGSMHHDNEDLLLVHEPHGGTRYDAALMEAFAGRSAFLWGEPGLSKSVLVITDGPARDDAAFNMAVDHVIERELIDAHYTADPLELFARSLRAVGGKSHTQRIAVMDDPFMNVVLGRDEPNDRRKGFYRDFEGKRRDGSYKRSKRGRK